MEKLKIKLDEIIDFDMKKERQIWEKESITKIEEKYSLSLPEDYIFYLRFYGNDYIKDDYRFKPTISLPKNIRQSTFELDSIFGLGDHANSFEKKLEFYQETLPAIIFPIADLPGGDLVCMEKESNKIYFWFHELEGENIFLAAENFQEFIVSFQHEQVERANLNNIKLNLSSELDSALRKAAEKYRK